MAYERSAYHSQHPAWRSRFRRQGEYFGIELEREPIVNQHYSTVLTALPDLARYRPLVETDGSLSHNGIEFVFPPMKLSTYKNAKSGFRQMLKSMEETTRSTRNTGMHININTTGWPVENISRYMALIHNMPQNWLENIGGRQLNHYCRQYGGGSLAYVYDYCYRSHSYAIERGTNRMEARFPHSTTDHTKIVNLLEFFTELKAFVFDHEELWVPPAEAPIGYGAVSYVEVLRNLASFWLTTKTRKKIGGILTYGYPS